MDRLHRYIATCYRLLPCRSVGSLTLHKILSGNNPSMIDQLAACRELRGGFNGDQCVYRSLVYELYVLYYAGEAEVKTTPKIA